MYLHCGQEIWKDVFVIILPFKMSELKENMKIQDCFYFTFIRVCTSTEYVLKHQQYGWIR